jgi:Amt family ammonium transporter
MTDPAINVNNPVGINNGDVSFMLLSSALVMLMTPALSIYYAGQGRLKNFVTTMGYTLLAGITLMIIWHLFGFSLAFGPSTGQKGFIGNFDYFDLFNIGMQLGPYYNPTFPLLLYSFFEMQFAVVTGALVLSGGAERIKLSAFMIFASVWVIVVYAPIACWVWNENGWGRAWGVLDFAGGTVCEINSGFSSLALAIVIGKRKNSGQSGAANPGLALLGTGLLWFGWFGFNGGSAVAANGLAVIAYYTTNTSAACASLTWMLMDVIFHGKVQLMGICGGAIAGLVAITPCAGFVSPTAALAIGVTAGMVCWTSTWLVKKNEWFDDVFDCFSVHGCGGVWGMLMCGLFAQTSINPLDGHNGAFFGNPMQLVKQLVAVACAAGWAFTLSFLIALGLKYTIGLRADESIEEIGFDRGVHEEEMLPNKALEWELQYLATLPREFDPKTQNVKVATGPDSEKTPLKFTEEDQHL